jgi:predicted LPLAT superfamily acyltransferase
MSAKHWAQMEETSFIWGIRFLLSVYLLCGRRVLQVFLYPVVIYYWLLNRAARTASRDYLGKLAAIAPKLGIHGSLPWSYRHFISFANALVDKLAAWSGALSLKDVVYHGRDRLLEQAGKGQGILLLGSHLGNLEVCRVIADSDKAIRTNVLVHTKHAEKFNRLLNRNGNNPSLNLIQVTDITAATAQLLYDKICAGELVIMAADRTPVANSRRVSRVDFFGAKAEFPQGPFILGALLKCPVYTLFCLKQQGKYHLYFDHFSDSLVIPRQERDKTIQCFAQRYADLLQAYCLQAPLQWFNFFDFWHLDTHARQQ